MPVASLVLGILGTLLCWHPLLVLAGLPMALIALILGVMSRKQLAAQNQPTGMATAGMVLGIVGTTFGALILAACAACAACVGTAGKSMSTAIEKAAEEAKKQEEAAAAKNPAAGEPAPAPVAPSLK
jgi:hypothetical protein